MPRTLAELPGVTILAEDSEGKIISAVSSGAPELTSATAGYFAKGCSMLDSSRGIAFTNSAVSSATPVWRGTQGDVSVVGASATIATTGNTDCYIIAPVTGYLSSFEFSGTDALAGDDTNYITWTVKNLNKGLIAPPDLLATDDLNTTKDTGGQDVPQDAKIALVLSATTDDLFCDAGDRLLIRAAATGTLANTISYPSYCARFQASA